MEDIVMKFFRGRPSRACLLVLLWPLYKGKDKIDDCPETIAKEIDCSTRTVKKHLKRLQELDYITKRSGQNVYDIHPQLFSAFLGVI